jgi:hypothetical protein
MENKSRELTATYNNNNEEKEEEEQIYIYKDKIRIALDVSGFRNKWLGRAIVWFVGLKPASQGISHGWSMVEQNVCLKYKKNAMIIDNMLV